ncbi:hypothetical protein BV22DRAFT_234456 [Leucogyrophana mollusca]|uniref:Uncharacterized protein n=1 Tax=Leucogyrophana mollusca TaxID=85980 RepID=A0ACB8BQ15_9AGAM|nr:hypothetical protein BV22DRAFT_234456 [Leucogyrophana mollusca]
MVSLAQKAASCCVPYGTLGEPYQSPIQRRISRYIVPAILMRLLRRMRRNPRHRSCSVECLFVFIVGRAATIEVAEASGTFAFPLPPVHISVKPLREITEVRWVYCFAARWTKHLLCRWKSIGYCLNSTLPSRSMSTPGVRSHGYCRCCFMPTISATYTSEQVKAPLFDTLFAQTYKFCPLVIASVPCIAATGLGLALRFPSPTSSQILSVLLPSGQPPAPTPSRYLVASTILCIVGSVSRIWCFRTLGRHFTYELSLQREHQLVTGGPYAFVRHPSYTSGILAMAGMTLVHLSPGSFTRSCGWLNTTSGRTLFGVGLVQLIWAICVALGRTRKEDMMLKERFGDEWKRYARRVQYRLIPWVY